MLAGSIDHRAVIDAVYDYGTVLVADLVDDPVRAASSRVQTGQLALQRRADELGIVGQRAEHKLHDRRRGSYGEAGQLSLGGTCDLELVGRQVLAH